MGQDVVAKKASLIAKMADARGMDPDLFANTVRTTCMPGNHTNEQFAAFMLVADRYDLDPVLKEIYAFPAKGGGIVPIVSIDGWVNLVNSHPAFDGMDFDFHEEDGNLISCTCKIFRKDRGRPTVVTEYLEECARNTEPWKMKHRMLRHKTMIQCARYAFGFGGVYDEDEAERMKDVTPQNADGTRKAPPRPPEPEAPAQVIEAEMIKTVDFEEQPIDEDIAIEGEGGSGASDQVPFNVDDFLNYVDDEMAAASDAEDVAERWESIEVEDKLKADHPDHFAMALSMRRDAEKRVKA